MPLSFELACPLKQNYTIANMTDDYIGSVRRK